jgi:hypothetical protein
MMPSCGKVVSLLELLRVYADIYASCSSMLGMFIWRLRHDPSAMQDHQVVMLICGQLLRLLEHCEDLPITSAHIGRTLPLFQDPEARFG